MRRFLRDLTFAETVGSWEGRKLRERACAFAVGKKRNARDRNASPPPGSFVPPPPRQNPHHHQTPAIESMMTLYPSISGPVFPAALAHTAAASAASKCGCDASQSNRCASASLFS